MEKPTKRIILWSSPRSMSTAFYRAMSSRNGTKAFMEPFGETFYFGCESQTSEYKNRVSSDKVRSFNAIKQEVEADFSGYDTVFVKEIARHVTHLLPARDILPRDYVHTFLIRDPGKIVRSQYNALLHECEITWEQMNPDRIGVQHLYEMFKFVADTLGHPAIIVDAGDLVRHPETILKLYCDKVGIEYQTAMLNWKEGRDEMKILEKFGWKETWFNTVTSSNTFLSAKADQPSFIKDEDLPSHIRTELDKSDKLYKEMFSNRIHPDSETLT